MVEREAEKINNVHLEIKANRASEQRRERLRIRREKDRAKITTKKLQEEEEKVVNNRRQRESVPEAR